jgi:hypothetical protein
MRIYSVGASQMIRLRLSLSSFTKQTALEPFFGKKDYA